VASLPLLLGILYIHSTQGSLTFSSGFNHSGVEGLVYFKFLDLMLFLALILAFLVKIPLFFFHL
jgi:NADH:ubiquinone oxidoreductase subunit 4 (subunit M)